MARIAVFCSSSSSVSPIYFAEVESLAQTLVGSGFEIIYGGASVGLMGCLADKALECGGSVYGVIPKMDFAMGIEHRGLTDQKVVNSLWERKQTMVEEADAFLVFPGGLGTLDEAFEILALKQTGQVKKPLIFVNTLQFWNPLLEMLQLLREQSMISQDLDALFKVLENPQEIIDYLKAKL